MGPSSGSNKFFESKSKQGSSIKSEEPKQINFAPPKKLIPLSKRVTSSPISTDTSSNASLRVGSVVEHEKFGIGEITAIEGVYPEAKATIAFKNAGEKNLLLKFAKLKVVM